MFKTWRYVIALAPDKLRQAVFWELLHGVCVALPTGLLMLVLTELFKAVPDTTRIWQFVGLMTLLLLGQFFLARKAMVLSSEANFALSNALRMKVGNHLQKLSLGFFKTRDAGDIAAVILQDIANFEHIFGHSIPNLSLAVFSCFTLSLFLIFYDWRLALCLLVALPLVWPLFQLGGHLVQRLGKPLIRARNATGARFLEYVQGIRYLKAFGQTGSRFSSLDQALEQLRRSSIQIEALPGPLLLTAGIVFEVMFLLMVALALYFWAGGSLTIPVWLAFLILGYHFYQPLKVLMVDAVLIRYMMVSLERVIEVLETPLPEVRQPQVPEQFDLCFDQVSFGYTEERPVLQEISFQAPARSMVALVGASGSGKTTLMSLLARFWDVDSGSIRIGGVDLRQIPPEQFYGLISEVFQDVYLFDDSIYNNVKIGKPEATEAEVLQALRVAQCFEFIESLPQGVHSLVGEGGNRLSGGQKQRISIARALLKDAPIVLLDEATASLDPENEVYIQQAVQALVQSKTVLVIAHKLATVQQAELIVVLDQGRIEESGNHAELLAKQGRYARLWHLQQQARGWKLKAVV